jgi:hypothetical protein
MNEIATAPRTVGGSLLRQSLDEMQRQIQAQPGEKRVTAFVAFDKETGAQVGAAAYWQGPKGSEWIVTAALSRKVQAAQSPYAVRLELQGTW